MGKTTDRRNKHIHRNIIIYTMNMNNFEHHNN